MLNNFSFWLGQQIAVRKLITRFFSSKKIVSLTRMEGTDDKKLNGENFVQLCSIFYIDICQDAEFCVVVC